MRFDGLKMGKLQIDEDVEVIRYDRIRKDHDATKILRTAQKLYST